MNQYFVYLLVILHILFIKSVSAETDFLVKKTSSGDETYTSEIKEISIGTSLSFQISALWWTTQKEFQITFPAWFSYSNHSIDGNCTTQVTVQNNSFFKYHFSGSNNCVSEVTFQYVANQSGNFVISIFEWNTLTQNVKLGITGQNTIIKAISLDQNNNGFLDGYEVYFSYPISNISAYTDIKVSWVWVSGYVWNTLSWVILFPDHIFHTGELPQILSSSSVFGNVGILSNLSVIEEDSASPILVKINGATTTQTGYISNGAITFDFSERLNPDKKDFIIKKWTDVVWGNYILNQEKLTFTPSTPLSVGNYQFTIGNNVEDFSQNKVKNLTPKTLIMTGNVLGTCSWLPDNASWNSVSEIHRYWNGISFTPSSLIAIHNETPSSNECRFICNTGFSYQSGSHTCRDSLSPTWWSLGSGTGILISNGSENTQSRYVNLSFLAFDTLWVSEMMISNQSNFSQGTWENYATGKTWTLSEWSWNKSVYVKFRDASLNESDIFSDTITYMPLDSYLTFGSWVNIYTHTPNVSLFWTCRLIDNYGVENNPSIIQYSVNNIVSGSLNCINYTWSGSINITSNSTNSIKIWFENAPLISNSFNVIHPTPLCNTPTNGIAIWTYPNCDFSCNSWYIKSGNSCIASTTWWSSGGGWGWGSSWWSSGGGWFIWNFCNVQHLQCISQNGVYVWQKKSWMMCSSWMLWQKCTPSEILVPPKNETDVWWNNTDMIDVKNTLLSYVHTSLHSSVNQLYMLMDYPHKDYFIIADKNALEQYNILKENYQLLFENINSYLTSKDTKFLSNAKKNYTIFYNSHKKLSSWEDSYITKVKKWTDIIYETKILSLQWSLSKIEKIIIGKYKTQLSRGKISKQQYEENIFTYNSFILYLSIYKKDNTTLAKEFGKKALEKVIKNYSLQ